jgi:hypothetical protein
VAFTEQAPVSAGQHNSEDKAVFEPQSEGYSDPVGRIVPRVKINLAFEPGEAGNGQPGVLDEALIEVNRIADEAQGGSVQEQFSNSGPVFNKLHHAQISRSLAPFLSFERRGISPRPSIFQDEFEQLDDLSG